MIGENELQLGMSVDIQEALKNVKQFGSETKRTITGVTNDFGNLNASNKKTEAGMGSFSNATKKTMDSVFGLRTNVRGLLSILAGSVGLTGGLGAVALGLQFVTTKIYETIGGEKQAIATTKEWAIKFLSTKSATDELSSALGELNNQIRNMTDDEVKRKIAELEEQLTGIAGIWNKFLAGRGIDTYEYLRNIDLLGRLQNAPRPGDNWQPTGSVKLLKDQIENWTYLRDHVAATKEEAVKYNEKIKELTKTMNEAFPFTDNKKPELKKDEFIEGFKKLYDQLKKIDTLIKSSKSFAFIAYLRGQRNEVASAINELYSTPGALGSITPKIPKDFSTAPVPVTPKPELDLTVEGYNDIAEAAKDAGRAQVSAWAASLNLISRNKTMLEQFINAIGRAIAEMLVLKAVTALFNWVGSILPFHSGGLVKAHSGYMNLKSDEVPIIAQTGERVLSRKQNKAYERALATGSPLVPNSAFYSSSMRPVVMPVVLDTRVQGRDLYLLQKKQTDYRDRYT